MLFYLPTNKQKADGIYSFFTLPIWPTQRREGGDSVKYFSLEKVSTNQKDYLNKSRTVFQHPLPYTLSET
jgi:hypothetical protein